MFGFCFFRTRFVGREGFVERENGKDWVLGRPGMEVLFHLLINGVSWAYNPLTNHYQLAGTSKYVTYFGVLLLY